MNKLFFCLLCLINYINFSNSNNEDKISLGLYSSSVILVEANSGDVLYESNSNEKHYPASMTKMMGMYLVLKNIEEEKLHFDDIVTCSNQASSMGGTQIYLEPGEKMSVEDLFKSVCINSANDSIAALGEHIYGTIPNFVSIMNKTAKEIGMKNTHFKNCTGFDDSEHYSTCYDMSLIACKLVQFNEMLFRFTRLKEAYIRENSNEPFWLVNTNKLLGQYDGLDGLKTGYTKLANYNLTATAKRNNIRLISVVMNEKTKEERTQDTKTLLNYGFSKLKALCLFGKDEVITTYAFKKAKEKLTDVKTCREVIIVVENDVEKEDLKCEISIDKIYAPLEKGDVVGVLTIINQKNNKKYSYDLYVDHKIEQLSYINYILDYLYSLFV